jgi:hypothetical protein
LHFDDNVIKAFFIIVNGKQHIRAEGGHLNQQSQVTTSVVGRRKKTPFTQNTLANS